MTYRCQVSIPYYTAIPEDVVTNTWHFRWGGIVPPESGNFAQMLVLLENFYESVYFSATVGQMATHMRPLLTRAKIYDLDEPTPRTPILDMPVPLTVSTVNATVPTELALCLSFQGPPVSGEPQARRRGRVFLGGWGHISGTGAASSFPQPMTAALTNIATAAATLKSAGDAVDWLWCVYSPTEAAQATDPPYDTLVTNGWIDNAFDTQRRRGNAPSARTTFT